MKTILLLLSIFASKLYAQSYSALILEPTEIQYDFQVDKISNKAGETIAYNSMVYFNYRGEFLIKGDQKEVGTQKLLNNILSADSLNQKVRLVYREGDEKEIVYSGLVTIDKKHISNNQEKSLDDNRSAEAKLKALEAILN